MRKILIWLTILPAMAAALNMRGESHAGQNAAIARDTVVAVEAADTAMTVDVIGWFGKSDTVTYWIHNTSWKINDTDTVRTGLVSTKVRITVVDSTADGYKMDYTFLEIPTDTMSDTPEGKLQKRLIEKLKRKIIGTSVHFETDECGRITRYSNLDQIKKQAKSLFDDAMKEMLRTPEIKTLKKMGFDVKDYAGKVDADKLVEEYISELNLLFLNHGLSMPLGEITEHEDATETQYENTSYRSVSVDEDDGAYHVVYDVVNIIPQSDIKAMVGGVVEAFKNKSLAENFSENFDSQVTEDATYEDLISIDYMPGGWPYRVVKQKRTMIGNRGKLEQTVVSLDFCALH